MGCDIHGMVEVKRFTKPTPESSLQEWHPLLDLDSILRRSYTAFAFFFGVRGPIGADEKYENRGLPEDIHPQTKEKHDEIKIDAHSQSYYRFEEFYYEWHRYREYTKTWATVQSRREHRENHTRRSWETLYEMLVQLTTVYYDPEIRIIVWFDG